MMLPAVKLQINKLWQRHTVKVLSVRLSVRKVRHGRWATAHVLTSCPPNHLIHGVVRDIQKTYDLQTMRFSTGTDILEIIAPANQSCETCTRSAARRSTSARSSLRHRRSWQIFPMRQDRLLHRLSPRSPPASESNLRRPIPPPSKYSVHARRLSDRSADEITCGTSCERYDLAKDALQLSSATSVV